MTSLHTKTPNLLETLEEIINNTSIQSNLTITHPDYQPLELVEAVANSLEKLPPEIQEKYLHLQLRTFIHSIYFDGSLQLLRDDGINDNLKTEEPNLENNTVRGINRNYYAALESNNSGKGFYEPGWKVIQQEDELLVVRKDDFNLHIEPETHLKKSERNPQISDIVAVLMPNNRLQQGYYIAIGDGGFVNMHLSEKNKFNINKSVDIYFNFTPQIAPDIVKELTQQLNTFGIPFSFKVAYDQEECLHRYDSGILNIESDDYDRVRPILQKIYADTRSMMPLAYRTTDFRPQVPLFTKYLAPGLSLAEVPESVFTSNETFGKNRCRIVADALLDKYRSQNRTSISCIKQQFANNNISLQQPYLNPNSQDIYGFE
ncbi:MAG: T3SS effector HopA1 family protein [Rivularia sp. (in: cyanobacteria)]